MCEKMGRVTAATEVHHVVPVETAANRADMEALMFNPTNVTPLCHKCHQQAHVELRSKSREERKKRERKRLDDFASRWGVR